MSRFTRNFIRALAFPLLFAASSASAVLIAELEVIGPAIVFEFEQWPVDAPLGDFTFAEYTGLGSVTARIIAIDINIMDPYVNTSGCQAADYSGFAAGNIALTQRGGGCFFYEAVENAFDAGAVGAVIFNQGNACRTDVAAVTLTPAFTDPIPVPFGSFAVGVSLAREPEVYMSVRVPEPASLALLGAGLFAVGLSRRARRVRV